MQAIRDSGCKAGIALNPSTPAESIEYLLEDIDLILRYDSKSRVWRTEFYPITT